MQKVVVTGGLGFIGSHVVDALLAAGRQVTIIDSMVAAVTDGREYEPMCAVHRVSIHEYLTNGGTFAGNDMVVHAASHVGPAGILRYQGSLGAEHGVPVRIGIDRDGDPRPLFAAGATHVVSALAEVVSIVASVRIAAYRGVRVRTIGETLE